LELRREDIGVGQREGATHSGLVPPRTRLVIVDVQHAGHERRTTECLGERDRCQGPGPPPNEKQIDRAKLVQLRDERDLESGVFENLNVLRVELDSLQRRLVESLNKKTRLPAHADIVLAASTTFCTVIPSSS